MKITLPNNGFGAAIMLTAILLVALVPFVIALWLTLMIAPWWVAGPIATAVSLLSLLLSVKYRT